MIVRSDRPETGAAKIGAAALRGFLGVFAASLCYYSLGHYDHNDHMYAVAPVLAQSKRLYADFAFVQTPLSALIFAQIFKLVGAVRFYTSLRIFSLALNLTILGVGIVLCRRHAVRKDFATFVFAGLYLWFYQADLIGAEIGNYTLALVLMAAALLTLDTFRDKAWMPLPVGLLAGLALSAKLSSIYIVIAFAILCLAWARTLRSLVAKTMLYGAGAVIGIAPILYYLLPDYNLFLFENVHFHYLSNIYRGLAPVATHDDLVLFSVSSGFIALGLLLGAAVAAFLAWKMIARAWPRARSLLAVTLLERDLLVLALAAIIGAVTPGVVFQQYLAAPAFAIFLFLALRLDGFVARTGNLATVCVAAVALLGVWRIAWMIDTTVRRQADGIYGIGAVANIRGRLSGVIAAMDRETPGCHGDLVTAFAVPAIGAGVPLSPISSTGSFAMRLDYIFIDKAPLYRRFSDPSRFLNSRSLILVGLYNDTTFEPRSDFETVMRDYAARNHFTRIALGRFIDRPIFLYAPPACAAPASGISGLS